MRTFEGQRGGDGTEGISGDMEARSCWISVADKSISKRGCAVFVAAPLNRVDKAASKQLIKGVKCGG